MYLLRIFIFIVLYHSIDVHYIMYHSNDQDGSFLSYDCLYAVWDMHDKLITNAPYSHNYYLIPYCRRPDHNKKEHSTDLIDKNMMKEIDSKELKQQNINGNDLLNWSLPIDVAEEYERSNKSNFYNCSLPWFGTKCQYRFPYDISMTFNDIVYETFNQRSDESFTTGTCYRFIDNCNSELWPMCLDWREICDQKLDCPNGEDERFCEELESNECNKNEYRCHNGQCIPLEFAWESPTSVDCLDGSDEGIEHNGYTHLFHSEPLDFNYNCTSLPIFACEERTARYPRQFVCGDGEYTNAPYMPITRAICKNKRDTEINRQLFTSLNHIKDENCRNAFYCALYSNRNFGLVNSFENIFPSESTFVEDCESLQDKCSSEWLVLPKKPVMFGFFQFIYFTNRSVDEFKENILPDLTCFDIKKCPSLTNVIINITLINGLTCTPTSIFTFYDQTSNLYQLILSFNKVIEECLTKGIDISCNNSTHFHCDQSLRCISYHRVHDGYLDCSFNEDESFSACSWNDTSRYQCSKENYSCLSPVAISNSFPDCKNGEDEEIYHKQDFDETTPYSKFCLGLAQQHMLDDTYNDLLHCELWPCDSPYVHCDQIWDCPNGVDELNCPDTNCSSNAHECYDSSLRSTYCLSAAQIVDEIKSDCDRLSNRQLYYINGNTINENEYHLWNKTKCLYANNICLSASLPLTTGDDDVCLYERQIPKMKNRQSVMILGTERQLCHLKIDTMQKRKELFLNAFRLGSFPEVTSLLSVKYISRINEEKTLQSSININISQTLFCHRGILILSGNNETKTCLCPPSYFGSQCQWQNQRISLTFQLIPPQTTFISAIFQIIIMLIDRQGNKTDQYEQIVYSPSRDCRTKFHLYLLYPQRTKSHLNNYSIHIDLFNKMTLKHWTSWFIPIPFQFLPVNRISTKLIIPKERLKRPCLLLCGLHGQCMQYTNNQSKYFCLCDQKYSGSFCNESYQCQCSEDSFCLTSNICICPLDRFGSKCYLKRSICSLTNNPCKNDGICIPTDDRINLHGYSCFCKENYFGLHCEVNSYRVSFKLDETITRSSSFVFIHFITIFQHAKHERTTILKKIPFDSDTIIFYTSKQFNIAFLQLVNQSYYLLIVRETFLLLENIYGEILPKQTCPYVKYFLNSTILKYETFYHPKYYPFVCRQYLHLMCFYDETLMCVCDLDRFANCFAFNHTIDNTCEGHNDCQNDGQCFQNNQTCPTMSICACKDCYYGGKCQMSNEGNLLSLDPIIGYYIKPNVAFYDQPFIIKVTMSITLAIFILDLIDVLLSILTFRMKSPRQVGCGYYLLSSSIISLFMIIMLGIKFLYLILSQMKIIQSEFQLLVGCKSIDMFLKSLLASNEWIIACVAMERGINTKSGPNFNKRKSRRLAKWVVLIVIGLTLISHLHDPYYRELIHDIDEDDQRIWCFVRYPPIIHTYNYFITLMHFVGPLIINTISAFSIVILVSRSRSNIQKNKPYYQHLQEQLKRHKHLLISPLALVLLGTPRLAFSFVSGCMRTPRDSWFYVIGYYFSFIPPILTFSAFVLPSDNYRKVFQNAIQQQIIRFRSTFLSKF